ncbi:MAG TPA: tRNA-dihydrouridine synthase family protein [Rectinemataceae bacterium]|nr:tRNA-dihydrouridine synthase family protein [Rectinemataceae bacterium]
MLKVSADVSRLPEAAIDVSPSLLPSEALLLAPMVALSHRALRELVFGFDEKTGAVEFVESGHRGIRRGLDLAYTEMTSAAALSAHSAFDESFVDAGPEPSRVVYQFYATKPERLPEALALVADRGAFGADINFGCSAPHILKAGGGAAWMREPEAAANLVRLARSAWSASLSAKLRIGAEDDYERLRDFCLGLVEAGIDFLTLHPRLEGQKFRRRGRWDYVGRLVEDLPVPVVGNGDIRGFEDWSRWMAEAKPAGIMIGREAVRRPWIFALIRGREADPAFRLSIDLRDTAFTFLELVEARLPPEFHETRAKRFFSYYCDNFSFSHHLNVKLQRAPDLRSMRLVLDEYLAEMPKDRLLIESA